MEHDHLIAMLNRLKLTAIRDQLDSLIDEAARRELTIREALSLFCEREIGRKDERRALVQMAAADQLHWRAELAEVVDGQAEGGSGAVRGSPLRPRSHHPVRALVSSV